MGKKTVKRQFAAKRELIYSNEQAVRHILGEISFKEVVDVSKWLGGRSRRKAKKAQVMGAAVAARVRWFQDAPTAPLRPATPAQPTRNFTAARNHSTAVRYFAGPVSR